MYSSIQSVEYFEQMTGGVGEGCVGLSCSDARKVADVLEALPKLVTALKGAIEIAAPVDTDEVAQLEFAKQALELFTEPQPQP